MLCAAAGPNRKKHTAPGDSGGPLFFKQRGVDVLYGLNSFHSNPDVFARVAAFVDWIQSTIGKI